MSLIASNPAPETQVVLKAPQLPVYRVEITDEALASRKDCLEMSQEIVAVNNPAQRDDALVAAGMLKGLIKRMDETKAIVKRPILDAGTTIEEAAKGFTGALKIEMARVEKLVSDYTALELKRADELKQEEMRDMEAKKLTATAEELREIAARSAELSAPIPAVNARVEQFTDYELMDILALAKQRPDLVKMEPRRREILAYLSIPNHPPLAGICEFQATRTHSKAIL